MDVANLGFRVDLKGLKEASRELDNLGKAGDRVEKSGSKIDRSMRNASGGIGAMGAAGGGAAAKMGLLKNAIAGIGVITLGKQMLTMAKDFEGAMNNVAEKSNASADELAKLRDYARELGSTTSFSATEAADGLAGLAAQGQTVNEVMETMPTVLNFATASQIAVARAGEIVVASLNQFGIEATEAVRVSNLLAGASDSSSATAEDMAQAMKQAGTASAAAGVSIEDTTAALVVMAKAEIKGSEAGVALKAAYAQLMKPVGEGAKAFKRLGFELDEFVKIGEDGKQKFIGIGEAANILTDSGASLTDMIAILGREHFAKLLPLLSKGDAAFHSAGEALLAAATSAEQAETQMKGLPGAVVLAKSAFQGLVVSITNLGATSLADTFVRSAANAMNFLSQQVVPKFKEGINSAKEAYAVFTNALANSDSLPFTALRSVGEAITNIATVLAPVISYVGEFATALAGLGGAIAVVKLVGLAISAIGAAVAIATSPISLLIIGIAAIAAAAKAVHDNWDGISAWWSGLWTGMSGSLSGFSEGWEKLKATFAQAAPLIRAGVSEAFGGIVNLSKEVLNVIGSVVDKLIPVWAVLFNVWTSAMSAAWNNIVSIFELAWVVIRNVVHTGWDLVVGILTVGLKLLQGDFLGAWDAIVNTVKDFGVNMWTAMKEIGVTLANVAYEIGSNIVGGIKDAISSKADGIKSGMTNLFSFLPGVGDDLAEEAERIGENIPESLAIGIEGSKDHIVAAEKAGNQIIEATEDTLQIRSPSRIGIGIGGFWMEGVAIGLDKGVGSVVRVAETASGKIIKSFDGLGEGFDDFNDSLEDTRKSSDTFTRATEEVVIATKEATQSFEDISAQLQQQKILYTEGEEAARRFELAQDKLTAQQIEQTIASERQNEQLKEQAEAAEAAANEIGELGNTLKIQNILLEEGEEASRRAALELKNYSAAEIDRIIEIEKGIKATESAIAIQDDFARGLENSIKSADSVKGFISNLGAFLRNWLKEQIAHFAANKIFAFVGLGGDGVDGIGSALSSIFGGGGASVPAGQAPIPGIQSAGGLGFGAFTSSIGVFAAQVGIFAAGVRVFDSVVSNGVSLPFDGQSVLGDLNDKIQATGDTVRAVFADLGPAQQTYLRTLIETNGGLENATQTIEFFNRVIEQTAPIVDGLVASGADLGSTLDEQAVNVLYLVDALGGLEVAIPLLEKYLLATTTEAERAGLALDRSQGSLDEFNESLGLTGSAAIDTVEELKNYVNAQDQSTAAGRANAAAAIEQIENIQAVEAAREAETAAISNGIQTLRDSIETTTKNTEGVGKVLRGLGINIDELDPASRRAADGLVSLFGSLENFERATQEFISTVYSPEDQEQLNLASAASDVKAFNDEFGALAVQMGATTDGVVDTRQEIAAFVEGLISMGLVSEAEGQRMLEAGYAVADSIAIVEDSGKSLDQIISGLPPRLQGAFDLMESSGDTAADSMLIASQLMLAASENIAGAFGYVGDSMFETADASTVMGLSMLQAANETEAFGMAASNASGEVRNADQIIQQAGAGWAQAADRVGESGGIVSSSAETWRDSSAVVASASELFAQNAQESATKVSSANQQSASSYDQLGQGIANSLTTVGQASDENRGRSDALSESYAQVGNTMDQSATTISYAAQVLSSSFAQLDTQLGFTAGTVNEMVSANQATSNSMSLLANTITVAGNVVSQSARDMQAGFISLSAIMQGSSSAIVNNISLIGEGISRLGTGMFQTSGLVVSTSSAMFVAIGNVATQMVASSTTVQTMTAAMGKNIGSMAFGIFSGAGMVANASRTANGALSSFAGAIGRVAEAASAAARKAGSAASYANSQANSAKRFSDATRSFSVSASKFSAAANRSANQASSASSRGLSNYLGSFSTGLDYVPKDGLANIHQGEMVVPRNVSDWMRSAGIDGLIQQPKVIEPAPTKAAANDAVVSELQMMRRKMEEMNAMSQAAARRAESSRSRIVSNTERQAEWAEKTEQATDQLSRKIPLLVK